jgi:hypothetical protein
MEHILKLRKIMSLCFDLHFDYLSNSNVELIESICERHDWFRLLCHFNFLSTLDPKKLFMCFSW